MLDWEEPDFRWEAGQKVVIKDSVTAIPFHWEETGSTFFRIVPVQVIKSLQHNLSAWDQIFKLTLPDLVFWVLENSVV